MTKEDMLAFQKTGDTLLTQWFIVL